MASSSKKVALVMGVANQRSIAWSCVQSFVNDGWQVIVTYQNDKTKRRVQPLLDQQGNNVLGGISCDVTEMNQNSDLFSQQLADLLEDRKLQSVVHSLAHAPNLKTTPLLQTSLEAYTEAHEISAHSLISIAQATQPFLLDTSSSGNSNSGSSSITTLSYLGAVRAIPGYHVMGPAKASLEAIVRGLAVELAPQNTRVNAVSAGPIATLAAKGGIAQFERMQEEMRLRAPLGQVTAEQVASTVTFLATQGTGITGQTIYVDGGYSIVGGPPPAAYSK
jgi:enoyl-[acyl-carrier protein] reductase I